jgi:hypothetical protein
MGRFFEVSTETALLLQTNSIKALGRDIEILQRALIPKTGRRLETTQSGNPVTTHCESSTPEE